MRAVTKVFLVILIWGATSVAWLFLGGVMLYRADHSGRKLDEQVEGLWGRPQTQHAPMFSLVVDAESAGTKVDPRVVAPSRSDLTVDLALDQRLKGLRWFSLYDVDFDGSWTFEPRDIGPREQLGVVELNLPDPGGVYDDFHVWIDGEERDAAPFNGKVTLTVDAARLASPEPIALRVRYKSRGLDRWSYVPASGSASLRNFSLRMTTDFDKIDFPESSLSPSSREHVGGKNVLAWTFSNIVTQSGVGMVMPQRIQPGQLASQLSFSAPVSLLFFFLVIAVLARLKELDVHPVNYVFLGAAFFSFHLLFAYSVDVLPIGVAFALASVTSVAMVTTYLRLVVSARFAFVQAGLAQLVYLVGFSLAHFFDGLTGLTVTVLSIATLFLLMLLTGKIRWSTVFDRPPIAPVPMGPFRDAPQPPTVPLSEV